MSRHSESIERVTRYCDALGASIVVTDISAVQLALNAERLSGTDAEHRVQRRELLDLCDTSRYGDGEFDAVIAFAGPREIEALVQRSGGRLMAASASNWASLGDTEAADLEADPARWARSLEHEVAACSERGALDGATHVLFAAAPLPGDAAGA